MSHRLNIALKRAYEDPLESDGLRILVERLWPRGVSRDRAAIDHWPKEIAPSSELRRWYGHRPERWPEFQRRYRSELDATHDAVNALEKLCSGKAVTFVFAARDVGRNGAVVLKEYLETDPTSSSFALRSPAIGRRRPASER